MRMNPLYKALNNKNDVMSQVQRFRQEMSGKNPNEEINKLLQSGRITQEQLNQAQQMALRIQSMFK